MTIIIGGHKFSGPYWDTNQLENRSGVYAIICRRSGTSYVIDVGESAQVKDRVENHNRKQCWNRNCTRGTVLAAILYTSNTPQSGRKEIEQAIRGQYAVPCGEE